jgi:hypothetical protein
MMNRSESVQLTRRQFGLLGLFPFFRHHKSLKMADARFQMRRHGRNGRHYIWVHGNEQTARGVLLTHMETVNGRAFLVDNTERNVRIGDGKLDPNRMFSREGAGTNLRSLNPAWHEAELQTALIRLDHDRGTFLKAVLPPRGELLVALHNNGPGYSVQDEAPISDAVALNNKEHPHEFMLCTSREDFQKLVRSPFNVVLQNTGPKQDDGSLSRLAASLGVRYVNIEASHGNAGDQTRMLDWIEKELT